MLGRAANLYKMSKNWGKAGNTFTTIGEHHAKKGTKHDAATNFVEAANCYKKTDPKEASESLIKAIDIYTDMGRWDLNKVTFLLSLCCSGSPWLPSTTRLWRSYWRTMWPPWRPSYSITRSLQTTSRGRNPPAVPTSAW